MVNNKIINRKNPDKKIIILYKGFINFNSFVLLVYLKVIVKIKEICSEQKISIIYHIIITKNCLYYRKDDEMVIQNVCGIILKIQINKIKYFNFCNFFDLI